MILRYIKHYSVITLQTCMCATLNLFLLPVSIEGQWCERRRPPLPSASGLQKCLCTHGPISSTSGGTWTQSCPACSLSPKIFKGPWGPTQETHNHGSTRTNTSVLTYNFTTPGDSVPGTPLQSSACHPLRYCPAISTDLEGSRRDSQGGKEERQVKKRVRETDRVSERLEQETGC